MECNVNSGFTDDIYKDWVIKKYWNDISPEEDIVAPFFGGISLFVVPSGGLKILETLPGYNLEMINPFLEFAELYPDSFYLAYIVEKRRPDERVQIFGVYYNKKYGKKASKWLIDHICSDGSISTKNFCKFEQELDFSRSDVSYDIHKGMTGKCNDYLFFDLD